MLYSDIHHFAVINTIPYASTKQWFFIHHGSPGPLLRPGGIDSSFLTDQTLVPELVWEKQESTGIPHWGYHNRLGNDAIELVTKVLGISSVDLFQQSFGL